MKLVEYINRDLELLRKRVVDVSSAYDQRDPEFTMRKAKVMFEAFTRRFDIEDFLFSKLTPAPEMVASIGLYLKKRSGLRNRLEDMLMLHVSEPEFMRQLQLLAATSQEHLQYSEQEFLPNFIGSLSESENSNLSNALEDRLHNSPLGVVLAD